MAGECVAQALSPGGQAGVLGGLESRGQLHAVRRVRGVDLDHRVAPDVTLACGALVLRAGAAPWYCALMLRRDVVPCCCDHAPGPQSRQRSTGTGPMRSARCN